MVVVKKEEHFVLIDYPRAPQEGREAFGFHDAWCNLKNELQRTTGIVASIARTTPKNQICISFSHVAGQKTAPDLQKFVRRFSEGSAKVMPDNPIKQMIFSRNFPGL